MDPLLFGFFIPLLESLVVSLFQLRLQQGDASRNKGTFRFTLLF